MPEKLTNEEKLFLLHLARKAIECAVNKQNFPPVDRSRLSPAMLETGASFVTITQAGQLRGCIGALEPYQPLWEDVIEHARAAALEDWRFSPVESYEVAGLEIEVSRLTAPQPVTYELPTDLPRILRHGIDGVVIQDGSRRATFLPQVWEKITTPEDFLSNLCMKMGAPANLWRQKKLNVFTYQVEEFHEE